MSRARGSEPEGAPVALSADELRSCGALEDETYQTAVYAQADSDYSVLTLVPVSYTHLTLPTKRIV